MTPPSTDKEEVLSVVVEMPPSIKVFRPPKV
jgi:hypothetical protein